jgi:hypothetical protein
MFAWFISPWEAARLSWEAQRLMAFLSFTSLPVNNDDGESYPTGTDPCTPCECRRLRAVGDTNEVHGD